MKAKIIYSDKFLDRVGIFMKIGGITLWPFIILREYYQGTTNFWRAKREKIINHESIHIAQQGELLVIPFYVLYILEWFIKLFFYGSRAYYNISFEREAYKNELDLTYLSKRKRYSWIKLIFKK
jgi:beta-lactamase regulating signal transducer with metallopeptidase domain|tara:strand:- start:1511 stop:1882 length:372 start_codon:yes stop_codon:yes gene_type:complete